mgnify:CR=1 FL=1
MGESYKIFSTSTCKKCCVVFSFKLNIDSFIKAFTMIYVWKYVTCHYNKKKIYMLIYLDIILENNSEWEQKSNFKICLVH